MGLRVYLVAMQAHEPIVTERFLHKLILNLLINMVALKTIFIFVQSVYALVFLIFTILFIIQAVKLENL